MTAVGSTLATVATSVPQLPVVSSSAAHTWTVKAPLSPYGWWTENVRVAFGRTFSPGLRAPGGAPSSKEMVAESGSSQPGSVTVPETVTVPRSSMGVIALIETVGATLVTVTVLVSVAVWPKASVTAGRWCRRRPGPRREGGVGPTASSYWPSSSRSHS